MSVHYTDDHLTIHAGDVREVLPTLPADSVHCVVTSPPYWGLRDYGTATWGGGDEGCDHAAAKKKTRYDYALDTSPIQKASRTGTDAMVGAFLPECPCGARRIDSQLGLEPTPEEYVADLVAIFREVRRVLRADGTVWLNLGDSYANDGKWGGSSGGKHVEALHGQTGIGRQKVTTGLKPKDLVGIPWRVAFALQADGWFLRSDIIWSKPNPMPESVTDRPTKAHEYVFLLTKSARYWYDAEAVRRPISPYNLGRVSVAPHGAHVMENGHRQQEVREYDEIKGANMRTVWEIATQPYPGAHFATFPEKLVEPCVKAGCPPDGVVLDPFAGSGTTARVANRLGRRAVLIELNPDYIDQALTRNAQAPLGLGA